MGAAESAARFQAAQVAANRPDRDLQGRGKFVDGGFTVMAEDFQELFLAA